MRGNIMKSKLALLTLAASFVFSGSAMALTKDEYKTQKDRIEADYKASREKCGSLDGNAKDICQAEAKGTEKVAKAELEAQYKPSPRNDQKTREAKANAAYDLAKEKCDDQTGNAKDVCVKDAKAAQATAKANAKVSKVSAEGGRDRAGNVAEARKDANADKNEAQYKAAKERCDALSGNAKDSCQNDAKSKFGMK
jgi:hypothetical protein